MSHPDPYICEAADQSSGRPATFIFLHGFGDDAEGIPLALAQQFQMYNKLPYLRWHLANAGRHPVAIENAWYMPTALPNAQKPRVPGQDDDLNDREDDEEGILQSCDRLDAMVRAEIDRGVDPSRIVVGGFSQGCAVSLVWGLTGKERHNVAGIVGLSGYFPLARRIGAIRSERGISADPIPDEEKVKWFLGHGERDILVTMSLFKLEQEELGRWVNAERDVEVHSYERMTHTTAPPEMRDMLAWFNKVVPP